MRSMRARHKQTAGGQGHKRSRLKVAAPLAGGWEGRPPFSLMIPETGLLPLTADALEGPMVASTSCRWHYILRSPRPPFQSHDL